MREPQEELFCIATDDRTRIALLDQIASAFLGTSNRGVACFLAGIVLTELHSRDVRLVAYFVLFEVCGRRLSELPLAPYFKIPENLDLPFLN